MSSSADPGRRAAAPQEGWLARAVRAVSRRVWDVEVEALPRSRRGAMRVVRIGYLAARGFNADACLLRASALTYITVLSLVPLLAFSFSVLKGFGFYDRFIQSTVTPFVERTFGAAPGAATTAAGAQGSVQMREAIDHVLGFVERTDVASLGILGLVLLLLTVVRLLGDIERALNDIWRVRRARRYVRKVADYLAIVIVTPIFFLAATAITTGAQDSSMVAFLRETLHLGPFIKLVLGLAPLAAMWIGFVFLFMTLPNARTPLASAAVGGFVAAVLWQLTLIVLLKFQLGIAGYNAIYASFAAIPIFLMWVNISWISVLIGAEVCAAHRSEPSHARLPDSRSEDEAFRERLALRVLTRIGEGFLSGDAHWSTARLSAKLRVPVHEMEGVLASLTQGGILAVTGSEGDPAFLPARDLETIRVSDILDALHGACSPGEAFVQGAFDQPGDRILDLLGEELRSSRHNVTVKSLSEAAMRAATRGTEEALASAAQGESADLGKPGPVRATTT